MRMRQSQCFAFVAGAFVAVTLFFNLKFLSMTEVKDELLLDAIHYFSSESGGERTPTAKRRQQQQEEEQQSQALRPKEISQKQQATTLAASSDEVHAKHEMDEVNAARVAERERAIAKAAAIAAEHSSNESVRQIELLLPKEEIDWIRTRTNRYLNEYVKQENVDARTQIYEESLTDPQRYFYNESTGYTKYQEDKEGPWIDFIIAGHPKTGTTTLVANLANVAPMLIKDFCVNKMYGLLNYVFRQWPKSNPEIYDWPDKYIPDRSLQLKGAKCPRVVADPAILLDFGYAYPRTKFIIGVRHPVVWLTSFHNMGHVGDMYSRMDLCPHWTNISKITGIPAKRKDRSKYDHEICISECRCGIPVCFHRSRLHLPLARIGKTAMTTEERMLLAPNDPDGGLDLFNGNLRNPIFVYDQSQMKEDSYWDEVASFLGLSYIPNANYHAAKGKNHNKTFCTKYYDEFRAHIMVHSYNMSIWMEDYFLPVAMDPNRPDVVVANATSFKEILQSYKADPCKRLVRRESDGVYILDPALRHTKDDGLGYEIHSTQVESCRAAYPPTDDQKRERKRKRFARTRDKRKSARAKTL